MKNVLVIVDWFHPASGGKVALPNGNTYTAPVKFFSQSAQEWKANAWSLRFTWLDKNSPNGSWFGLAEFLSSKAPKEWLEPDNQFEIY